MKGWPSCSILLAAAGWGCATTAVSGAGEPPKPPASQDVGAELIKACRANDRRSCLQAAELFLDAVAKGGSPSEGRLMTEAATRGCDQGEPNACAIAGAAHQFGAAGAVSIDLPRAAGHYERACSGGSFPGCASWSFAVVEGWGSPHDPSRTLTPVREACQKNPGDSWACAAAAILWAIAAPGSPDAEASLQPTFHRGCAAGHAPSCALLSGLHQDGLGVPRDQRRAQELCRETDKKARQSARAELRPYEPVACPRRLPLGGANPSSAPP
jgi:TPR repeat protein